jgi:hypothetical protein
MLGIYSPLESLPKLAKEGHCPALVYFPVLYHFLAGGLYLTEDLAHRPRRLAHRLVVHCPEL